MTALQDFSRDLFTWRCRGVVFYSICISLGALTVWNTFTSLLVPRHSQQVSGIWLWFRAATVLCGLQPVISAASSRGLQASDGFALPSLLHLGPRSVGTALIPTTRLLHRFSSVSRISTSLLLIAAYIAAGSCLTVANTRQQTGHRQRYGERQAAPVLDPSVAARARRGPGPPLEPRRQAALLLC